MKGSWDFLFISTLGIAVVLLLVVCSFDRSLAASTHQTNISFVSMQYIPSQELVRQGKKAYSDQYRAHFILGNKMQSILISPDVFRRLGKMKSENGSMEFVATYKKGLLSKEPVAVRIDLNSNAQFAKME